MPASVLSDNVRLVARLQVNPHKTMTNLFNPTPLLNALEQQGLGECVRCDEPLVNYTTFRIGGTAQVMLFPRTDMEIQKILRLCHDLEVEPRIVGGGSNLLIAKEIVPVVISLREIRQVDVVGTTVYASAGTPMAGMVKTCVQNGLEGLETFTGIPGTLGGALAGNSGTVWEGQRIDIGNFVEQVRVLGRDGKLYILPKQAIQFDYRQSSLSEYTIVDAVFQFKNAPVEILQARAKDALRKKLESQPLADRSAGCIFKNPAGTSAWKLIREAGLSGARIGAAMVSNKHANFIVNLGGARGMDVLALINHIRTQVMRLLKVELSLEVKIW